MDLDYQAFSLYQLHRLCAAGDQEALKEWKYRWESEYPKMGDGE